MNEKYEVVSYEWGYKGFYRLTPHSLRSPGFSLSLARPEKVWTVFAEADNTSREVIK